MAEEKQEEDLAGTGMPPAPAEAEADALHTELAQLRRQVDEHEIAAKARQHRGRGWAVGLLILLGCILLAAANVTVWLRSVVLNTNTWAATVGPLTQNEIVANAVSAYVVEGLFDLVDVEQAAQEILPPEYSFLSGSLARVLQNLVQETAATLIQSDEFNSVWVAVNRTVHRGIMGALRGDGSLLYLREGRLTIDLSDVFGFVGDSLGLRDLGLFQEEWAQFVILESRQVAVVQQALAVLDSVGLVLPLLALGVLVLAWVLSLWRRRTLTWIGIGVVVAMTLSLIAFALARPAVLISIADPLVRLVTGEIWRVVVRGLIVQTILLLAVGLLLIAGAALAGPGPRAVAIRTGVRDGWARLWKR